MTLYKAGWLAVKSTGSTDSWVASVVASVAELATADKYCGASKARIGREVSLTAMGGQGGGIGLEDKSQDWEHSHINCKPWQVRISSGAAQSTEYRVLASQHSTLLRTAHH